MAFRHYFSLLFSLIILSFLCFVPLITCISTVSISYVKNQTLVCALIPSSNQQTYLNCTSFPSGIRTLITSQTVSYDRIVGGNGFVCALRSSSSSSVMECWRFVANGVNISHKRIYFGPVLSQLEAGNSHICGLVNGTNQLKCWQWRKWNYSQIPHPVFSNIAVGEDFVCGLNGYGNVFCLSDGVGGIKGNEPSGNYTVIAAGSKHACAISSNGSIDCWGDVSMMGNKPQGDDQFKDLALGENRSCAIRLNGTVVCWGEDDFKIPTSLQETYFSGIVAKRGVFCGVDSSNYSLMCWGNELLDNNLLVFAYVMPGSCTNQCPCGPLLGYAQFCKPGLMVCQSCGPKSSEQGVPSSSLVPSPTPSLLPSHSGSKWSTKMVGMLVVGCVGSIALIVSIIFWVCIRCHGGEGSRVHDSGPIEILANPHELQGGAPLRTIDKRLSHKYSMGNGGNLEEFPLEVLLKVTNNFSQDLKMGFGSFGSVYHATLEDGREVAIKRAEVHASTRRNRMGAQRPQEDKDSAFMAELEFLSRLNHKHLVKLLGFYEDTNERLLVYEFMSNHTLHDHIHKLKGSSPLASWPSRLKVALDAARGIEYLHEYAVPSIIHRDIKPSNILLDSDWTAKVSDFGLSLMSPQDGESHLSLWAAGTLGYVDPEYYRLHQLTTKSDVYSFGVVLLELLSGYKAIHTNEDGIPRNVVDFVVPFIMRNQIHRVLDPNVPPPSPAEIEAIAFIGYLAVDCVSIEGRNRPPMSEVVGCLERALAACLAPTDLSLSSSNVSSR